MIALKKIGQSIKAKEYPERIPQGWVGGIDTTGHRLPVSGPFSSRLCIVVSLHCCWEELKAYKISKKILGNRKGEQPAMEWGEV